MNLPNKLTITRVLLVPLLILIYMFPYDTAGINVPVYHVLQTDIALTNIIILIIFIIASITDYFDGQIARKNKLITTFGKFADPIAASKLGKLKTVSQMIALSFLLVNNFPFSALNIDVATILAWVATIISVISGIDYFIKNQEMLTETM